MRIQRRLQAPVAARENKKRQVRGRGSSIEGTYLFNYGLGESLTHTVRFLRGLVGEKAGEVVVVVSSRCPREHRFVMRRYGVVWGVSRESERTAATTVCN